MLRSDRTRLYNALTIVFLALTALSGVLVAWIATHPQGFLNPFPAPPTPTLIPTAAPTDTPTTTATLSPTLTPSITPTHTITFTPSLSPTASPTLTPLPTLAPAWLEAIVEDPGYTLHLPNTWVVFDLTVRSPAATLNQIAEENPSLYTSLGVGIANTGTDSLSLLAFDASSVNAPFIINLSAAEAGSIEGRTVEDVLAARMATYGLIPGYTMGATTMLSVDGQPAAQMVYTSEIEVEVEVEVEEEAGQEGEEVVATPETEMVTLTIHHRDIIIQQPDRGVMSIAFVIDAERLEEYAPIVDQMMSTFRFLR